MAITNFPNGVSSSGMPVIGSGMLAYMTTGSVFFVDSATGSNGNSGTDPDHPLATIDYAIGKCTANKADKIVVMPNHTETLTTAGAITCDIAGVHIMGLGTGGTRPAILVSTSTGVDIEIDAADVTIENIYFDLTGVDAVAAFFDVDAAYFALKNCEVLMADGSGQAAIALTADANADYLSVTGCRFLAPNDGASSAIATSAALTGARIIGNTFDGDFDVGAIDAATGTAANLDTIIAYNFIRNDNAGQPVIDLGANTVNGEGFLAYNALMCADDTGLIAQRTAVGSMGCFENYAVFSDDKSGILTPAVDTTG